MRAVFHQQLDSLTAGIAELCGLAGEAMQCATQALLQGDLERAEHVITDHDQITAGTVRLEEAAFSLLARQAPVAGDLRAVLAAIKNVADVERMSVLALHVAKVARRRHPARALPEDVHGYFAEMGRIAVEIVDTTKSVRRRSVQGSAAAPRRRRHGRTAPPPVHGADGPRMDTRSGHRRRRHPAGPLLRTLRRPRRRDRPPRHLSSQR